ncbi:MULTISPECIES: Crp/Fnr family transcriptional regulator [unclassified Arcicella]|uniref:Crp/Fnr family transcriptional regulator n=1 Tax=unclassified Arcicella TaxID=2644986 RepID=UPI00285D00C0|nr:MULTISPECIES: Crp/Fnr family transcriptional regulator [unclassified Arcicella]MDR6561376.1 CRP/FNR family transcriptional regulator [Arcicella sp. BE51]MDR6811260.1 CRP/FNR family transcriptional regulator [Arcicella sp. BE140]MDR6822610.1 CRP/FNR family transcriptional regulator [Arcicella sp. BE139]
MQEEAKYWYLHDHQLFSVLSREENRALCLIPNFKTVKKNEIIYFSHDDEQRLYTIKSGTLKIVSVDAEGNETVKEILRSGDLFGQYTFDEVDENEDEYAIAISEKVVICSFKINDFENIVKSNPQLAIRYTKLVGFKLKRITNNYTNLMFKDVRTRFVLFLKDWVMKEGKGQTKDIVVKNYLTHSDIAGLICSTRQTVTMLFNELKNAGLIDYTRSEIIVKDVHQLA